MYFFIIFQLGKDKELGMQLLQNSGYRAYE